MNESQYFLPVRLDGGNLSLNFVNTIHDRNEEPLRDYLTNYSDLLAWAHFADGINEAQKKLLLQLSKKNHRKAEKIFKESIRLREAIYKYIVHLINQNKAPPVDTQLINHWLSKAFANLELTQLDNDIVLDWKPERFGMESVLWPIIRSFADLITSDMRNRTKQCPNCAWVFLDNSKNNSRRWCSMETCGNRAKVLRFARKTRP